MTLSKDKITFDGTDSQVITEFWRRTARSRLRFELAGLALAMKAGLTPEGYARHLWVTGASKWMGKAAPTAGEYLLKEAESFRTFYPGVRFEMGGVEDEQAELTFTEGCLGGWGKDPWRMARELDLPKGYVCRYCRAAFRIWANQLRLDACPEPQVNGRCILRVRALVDHSKA